VLIDKCVSMIISVMHALRKPVIGLDLRITTMAGGLE